MDFFADNEQLARIEADLALTHGAEWIGLALALAWHIRQRDTQRALILADEVQALLPAHSTTQPTHLIALRLMLIRAEAKWLFGELDASKALAENALQGFANLHDATGCADAHWLLAWLAVDQGDLARTNTELEAMLVAALEIEPVREPVRDPVRVIAAQAALARFAVFRDLAAAKAKWSAHLRIDYTDANPAVGCWVADFWGTSNALDNDYVQSIRYLSKTYTLAIASGQQRRVILSALNIGDKFNILNEYHAALEWMQRGLELARQCGWPGTLGVALMQTAETLRRLQRFGIAADMLREALTLMAPMSASRSYALTLQHFANVELDRKRYASAQDSFRLMEQRAIALSQSDLLSRALCGQAEALFQLGKPEQALRTGEAALAVAKSNANDQIAALRVLANIHTHHSLPPPPDMCAPSIPLYYLQQALDLAATIIDYTIPGDLLEAVADEYAKVGDIHRAYQFAKQSILAREKTFNQQALNRAHAMQVNHHTEQARAEAEYHRQLAAAEARRAELLQQAGEAQVQLAKQEKLASLGGLVAGFAHQLNTPIAAVKSSGNSIADSLAHTLQHLPHLFQTLDQENQTRFVMLIDNCQKLTAQATTILSTREERIQVHELISQLDAAGITNTKHKAGILVQLCAQPILAQVLPLLRHTQCEPILESARHFASLSGNATNINIAADRMTKIINALKSLSGLDQSDGKIAVLLHLGLESALAQHQNQMQNKVTLVREYQNLEAIPPLLCLPDQINQVWCSLIHNALQAMAYDGTLTIGIRQQGGEAVVTVKDTGAGIPEAIRPLIFDAFFTTKTVGESSGLGLAIVKIIIERHRGRIEVDSVEGGGATFLVFLPLDVA